MMSRFIMSMSMMWMMIVMRVTMMMIVRIDAASPTPTPTRSPTGMPTVKPTASPTTSPTSSKPTTIPTCLPTSPKPTANPSVRPTPNPTASPTGIPDFFDGYFTLSRYYVGVTCNGAYQTEVYSLGVCSNSSTSNGIASYKYMNASVTGSIVTVLYYLWQGSDTCNNGVASGYPKILTYSTSCSLSSSLPRIASTGNSLPTFSSGIVITTYPSQDACQSGYPDYYFGSKVSYPFNWCFSTGTNTGLKYISCDGTSYTARIYSDELCQFGYTEQVYSTVGACSNGVRYTCTSSTTKRINYGYLVSSNYYFTSPAACTGAALSSAYTLNVCLVNSKTSSTIYSNYTYLTANSFSLTVALYSDATCSTLLTGYPIIKSYSTTCKIAGTGAKTYYSESAPSLSIGLFVLTYLSNAACNTVPDQFSTGTNYPMNWCMAISGTRSYKYTSCNDTHYTQVIYTGSACATIRSTTVYPITCTNGTRVICSLGAPTPVPTTPPTPRPSVSPTVMPTEAPLLYSRAPTRAPTPAPSFPPSYQFAPGGYFYSLNYYQSAGCTGDYRVTIYSIGVCQRLTAGTSYMYSSLTDYAAFGYFQLVYTEYSDTACSAAVSAVAKVYLYGCNQANGVLQQFAHSVVTPTYPAGIVLSQYSSTAYCNTYPLRFETSDSYPLDVCYITGSTSFMYNSCNETMFSYTEYTDKYCQSFSSQTIYVPTNYCGNSVQYTCGYATSTVVDYGYFLTSKYFQSSTCFGYAQTTVQQLGVCVATSFTQSYKYYNYTKISNSQFSIVYAVYNSMNCTSVAATYPRTTKYSSSCTTTGGVPTQYSYTEFFPKLTNGLVQAYYLSDLQCLSMPNDFAAAVGYPSGWCFRGGPTGSFIYDSCTATTYTTSYYNDTKCSYRVSQRTQDIACANATSMICMFGQPTTAPTALPTRLPTRSPATLKPTPIPTSNRSSAPTFSPAPTARPSTRIPTALPTIINRGYFTIRSYYLTLGACTGDYQSTIFTINMCYPDSFVRSYRYSSPQGDPNGDYNLTQSFFNNGNCTGTPRFVQTISHTANACNLTGSVPQSYVYSTSFPQTSGGLMQSYYPSSLYCSTYPNEFIVAYVFPFNWCYGGTFRTAYYTSSCNDTSFSVKAFNDASCKTKMYNITTPTNVCKIYTAGNSFFNYRCISRPDPTASPTKAPIPFPTRAPINPVYLTAAPLKPTRAPVLNPASQLTYPPSSRPTLNITNLAKRKKKKRNYLLWFIVIGASILFCCIIGCIGYKKTKRRLAEKDAAEKRRIRFLKEEEMNSKFAAAGGAAGAGVAGAPGAPTPAKKKRGHIPPPASSLAGEYIPLTQEEKLKRKKPKIPPPVGDPNATAPTESPRSAKKNKKSLPSTTPAPADDETKEPDFGIAP